MSKATDIQTEQGKSIFVEYAWFCIERAFFLHSARWYHLRRSSRKRRNYQQKKHSEV